MAWVRRLLRLKEFDTGLSGDVSRKSLFSASSSEIAATLHEILVLGQ